MYFKKAHTFLNAKFYTSLCVKWWLLTNGNECLPTRERHGTLRLVHTSWGVKHWAPSPDSEDCCVHCVSSPLSSSASHRCSACEQMLPRTHHLMFWRVRTSGLGLGIRKRGSCLIHRLLNRAHWASQEESGHRGHSQPRETIQTTGTFTAFSGQPEERERGQVPSDSVITFISWFRPFMSAFQLKANVCEHVQRQRNKSNVEQFPRP